ncbi:hypothetical protein GCM10023191_098950 [Actinoallomurus oryzae]|uniref:Uncharacterized protein n=1 Tax=Actinoallomurus oryzae TaxID=502180 RepID=A0ABP8R8P5_9ACTN
MLMLKAGWGLIRETGRIFLQAAPSALVPGEIGARPPGRGASATVILVCRSFLRLPTVGNVSG